LGHGITILGENWDNEITILGENWDNEITILGENWDNEITIWENIGTMKSQSGKILGQ